MINQAKSSLWLMLLAAFTVGAVVMSLEMLASRYLNPYFGGTIFTWAALISVVLMAMMAGYFTGGFSVDKIRFPYVLEVLIICAAIYLLALPHFVDPVLEAVVSTVEDVKIGALIGALIITGLPVACLSTFTPIAIGRTLKDLEHTGRISGTVFAISTLGNIFGTLLTSFYLIPKFGTRSLTEALAVVLALAIALSLAARRKTAAPALLCLIALASSGLFGSALPVAATELKERAVLSEAGVLETAGKKAARAPEMGLMIAPKAAYPEGPVFINGDLFYTEMTRNRVMKVSAAALAKSGLKKKRMNHTAPPL